MFDLENIPAVPGTYALSLVVLQPLKIEIGRLGEGYFPAGYYFYIGSARGAGGLRSRVSRHVQGASVRHWHIDYLRAVAVVRNVFYTVADISLECRWSQALLQLPTAFIPVPHFGASDCRAGCAAHLIAFPVQADLAQVLQRLTSITPGPIGILLPTN